MRIIHSFIHSFINSFIHSFIHHRDGTGVAVLKFVGVAEAAHEIHDAVQILEREALDSSQGELAEGGSTIRRMMNGQGKFHDQGDAKWIVIRGQIRGHNDTPYQPPGGWPPSGRIWCFLITID
jgi:hypothetical protein